MFHTIGLTFKKHNYDWFSADRWQEIIVSDRNLDVICTLERPSIAWLASANPGTGMWIHPTDQQVWLNVGT